MGIPRGTARLMLDVHREQPFGGSVLQLGRSTIHFTWPELEKWARLQGVTLSPVDTVGLSHDPRLARQGCIDDVTFFRALGFETVECCDISEWEGADHVVNLNEPVGDPLAERFNVVVDPSSSPQIFHHPNLLANIHKMLKIGGRVVHASVVSNNHLDHGFYMCCPTFFSDFYRTNGWRLDTERLCTYTSYWHRGRFFSTPWNVYDYTPGCIDHLNYGRFGGSQAAIFVAATKLPGATGDKAPNLSQYERRWQAFEAAREGSGGDDVAAGEMPTGGQRHGLKQRLEGLAEGLFDRFPLIDRLYRPLKYLKERLHRALPRKMPPRVARY